MSPVTQDEQECSHLAEPRIPYRTPPDVISMINLSMVARTEKKKREKKKRKQETEIHKSGTEEH